MGACAGKHSRRPEEAAATRNGNGNGHFNFNLRPSSNRSSSQQQHQNRQRQRRWPLGQRHNHPVISELESSSIESAIHHSRHTAATVADDAKELIRQTLCVIRQLVNNEQEPPSSLVKLNTIAEKESGWQIVVISLIEAVPEEDALGPAVITLFLDESPLPSREAVSRLMSRLGLGIRDTSGEKAVWHRNACIVVGSLAEKMAGINSAAIFNTNILLYLLDNLSPDKPKQQVLFSLLALEKFAHTSENRLTIFRTMEATFPHPLQELEKWLGEAKQLDPLSKQVAFCAQWSLDNVFVSDSRTYACMITDVCLINAMLNHADVSEYLKIGPDGLEARSDVTSFESVRCTFEVSAGSWYYEAELLTGGVMQIGFATKQSRFLNHEGYGIGDDEHSVAYDGCRQLIWSAAKGTKLTHPVWKAGDVVGCLLEVEKRSVRFWLNGRATQIVEPPFLAERKREPGEIQPGIFAAASFMSFQHCRFNFGATPFRFPPLEYNFRAFNEVGTLTQEQKTILPRRRRVQLLAEMSMIEDACTICCERPADTITEPCKHGGLCFTCAMQVELCPFCRTPVDQRVPVGTAISRSHQTQV